MIEWRGRYLEWVAVVWVRMYARRAHRCINYPKGRQVRIMQRVRAMREVSPGQPFERGMGKARW
jgi:hypothetical protein